jgi:hypothetical protein
MFPVRTKAVLKSPQSRRSASSGAWRLSGESRHLKNEGAEYGALSGRRYAGRTESQLADGGKNKRKDAEGAERRREFFLLSA